MTWEQIWDSIKNFFITGGGTLLRALFAFIIGYVVIRIVMVVVKRILKRSKMESVAQNFLLSLIRFALYLMLVIIVLATLGVEITGIIAALASAGLAIGLALQNSLANIASGIVLMVSRPFKEGDYVSINGQEGKVKNVKILTTAIVSYDNKLIVLPNSTVAGNPIVNYSNRKQRRVDFTFSVAYESDVELVRKTVLDVMKSNGKVLLTPEPFCSIRTFNSSSIDFFSYCWCDTEDYWDVLYYVMDNVFNEFKRNGISIPFQQVEVRMREDQVKMPVIDRTLVREEKQREKQKTNKFDEFFDKLENEPVKKTKQQREQEKREKHEQHRQQKLSKKALKKQKKLEKQQPKPTEAAKEDLPTGAE